MMRPLAGLALLAVASASAPSAQVVDTGETTVASMAHLRGLDTLNGRTEDLDLRVGETATFGYLEITLETCRVPTADPASDAHAFLRIRDRREDEARFSGWMFASSPALSALDHPRYDVWVLDCSSF